MSDHHEWQEGVFEQKIDRSNREELIFGVRVIASN